MEAVLADAVGFRRFRHRPRRVAVGAATHDRLLAVEEVADEDAVQQDDVHDYDGRQA